MHNEDGHLSLTDKQLMEVLTHISKRIKVNPAIIVPVDKLGQQFLDPNASTLQKSFLLVYIQMGFPRLEETVCTPEKFTDRTQITNRSPPTGEEGNSAEIDAGHWVMCGTHARYSSFHFVGWYPDS